MIKVSEINSKSILCKSGVPASDYVINPYSGCAFGCSYCYADFMRRFTGHGKDKWGEYTDVKVNAVEVLEEELKRLRKRFKDGTLNPHVMGSLAQHLRVLFGSVCDPYQGVEAKYKITRKCLEVISKFNDLPLDFSILTKSHLVARDIDILKKIKNISVGLTITTTDDDVVRILEGNAPPASLRLEALGKLQKAGIQTYVCVNPLLPHFVANEKKLRKLFDAIAKTGNKEIWLEHINFGRNRFKQMAQLLSDKCPEAVKYYELSKTLEYKENLNRLIFKILRDYDFEIGGGGIIDHRARTITVAGNDKKKLRVKEGWNIVTV